MEKEKIIKNMTIQQIEKGTFWLKEKCRASYKNCTGEASTEDGAKEALLACCEESFAFGYLF